MSAATGPGGSADGPRPVLARDALRGRTVLVSGASRGIGREIALTFARAGADVVGVARSAEALAEVGACAAAAGGAFLPIPADVADVATLPGVVDRARDWRGRLDGLVNAAGAIVRDEPLSCTAADWDRVFAVNTRAAFFLCQAAGRCMLQAQGGAIVNVASLAGQLSTGASVAYSASKAALVQLTKVLAARWAPTVRVNAVGPGYVRTALNEGWLADPAHLSYVTERTPLARLGTPADVADLVLFLMLPNSGYITGQHILLDGGWSAR